MTRVVEKLPHIKYINKGRNGWTSGDIASRIETLDLGKADVYSIFLGTKEKRYTCCEISLVFIYKGYSVFGLV